MNPLTYETCEHYANGRDWQSAARYDIDWENSERKYKVPLRGVKVYENNVVEVHGNGYRDPHWRHRARDLGLDFVLPKELTGVELFDSETGRRVLKSELPQVIYLRHGNRLYYVRYNKPITFLHPDAQPIARSPVEYRVRNKGEEAKKHEAIKEHLALGQTLNAMAPADGSYYAAYLGWGNQQIVAGDKPLPADLTDAYAQNFCRIIASTHNRVDECIVNAAKDKFYPQYLLIKEK